LGEVLYFLLTGRSPFPEELISALILAKAQAQIDVRKVATSVSAPTARLVRAMLDPDPARRPTAEEVQTTCTRTRQRLNPSS
jgi:serine/threonine protein kinase